MAQKIFVYGTLKRGYGNHRLLTESRLIRTDKAPGLLFAGTGFPMAVPIEGPLPQGCDGTISGEVYEVEPIVLGRLDRLEGHPTFYRRTPVELQSGEQADIYYYQGPTDRLTYIPNGIWPIGH